MKSALTIAGSDPTGGAGLQADIKVFKAFSVHGLSVTAALTAQNTEGVSAIFPVDKDFFAQQLDVLLRDITPDAVKTGMLYSKWAIDIIAEKIKKHSLKNLVVDPVTVASSGMSLIEDGALDAMRKQLFPLARAITPNIYEAGVLTGVNIEDAADMEEAAKRLKTMGSETVIITGGHLAEVRSQKSKVKSQSDEETLDLIYDGARFYYLTGKRIEGEYHGTGCAFSSAITALLALGHTLLESARGAKEFINEAIGKAYHLGKGMGLLNL